MADTTDTSNEYWPEPVYFPQKTEQAPLGNNPQAALNKTEPHSPSQSTKKRSWPFFGKPKEPEKPLPTEAQITKAGPKDPPASPYPLIRLPMPFETAESIIQPGMYLLKPDPTPNTHGNAESLYFLLTQRNKTVLRFNTHPVATPDANLAVEGTPSPLSPRNPNAPTPMKVQIRVSPDQRTVTLLIQQAGQTWESPTYPTATDQRQILTY